MRRGIISVALGSAAVLLLLAAYACSPSSSTATQPPPSTAAPTSTLPPISTTPPTYIPTAPPAPTPTPAPGTSAAPTPNAEPLPVPAEVYPRLAQSAVTVLTGTVGATQPEPQTTQAGNGGYGLVYRDWDVTVNGYIAKPQPFNVVKVRAYFAATNSADPNAALQPLAIPAFSPSEKVLLVLDKWELQNDPLGPNQFTIVGAHAYEAEEFTGYFQLNGDQARVTKAFVPPPAFGPWQPLAEVTAALNAPVPTNTPCPP